MISFATVEENDNKDYLTILICICCDSLVTTALDLDLQSTPNVWFPWLFPTCPLPFPNCFATSRMIFTGAAWLERALAITPRRAAATRIGGPDLCPKRQG